MPSGNAWHIVYFHVNILVSFVGLFDWIRGIFGQPERSFCLFCSLLVLS